MLFKSGVSSSQSKKKINLDIYIDVPYEIRCPYEHEVDHDDVVLIRPSVEVVDGIFEDKSEVVDGEGDCQYF